jgi:hypothetical protein
MKLELSKSFGKKLQARIQSFQFEVGVLEDKPHYNAVETSLFGKPDLKNYAGGPARKQTRTPSDQSIGEVLVSNMKRLNINLLLRPFQEKNADLIRFTHAFLKLAVKTPGMTVKRVENLLQAVVRNPILKQEYGRNKGHTADAKGFDRHLIDTAQTFRAIKARARRV